MSIESTMPSSHLILCHPLLLLPPIPPSIRIFSNESTLRMRWPKYWSFSVSISPSNEHPGLISFRMDWLDLKKKKKIYIICFIHFFIVFLSPLTFPSVHKHFSSSLLVWQQVFSSYTLKVGKHLVSPFVEGYITLSNYVHLIALRTQYENGSMNTTFYRF